MQLLEHQEILSKTARSWLESRAPLNSLSEREREPELGDALWGEMASLGWLGLCLPQAHGGAEGQLSDLEVLCEELGRVLLPPPFLATAVAASAVLERDTSVFARDLLRELVAGRRRPVLAINDESGSWRPERGVRLRGGRVEGARSFVEGGAQADLFLVAATGPTGAVELVAVEADAPGVAVTPLATMAGTPSATVRFDDSPAHHLEVGLDALEAALVRTAVMHAAWCAGGARRLLELTVAYVSERRQFGVPLGSFQAVQHGLADCAIATVECETMARRAARSLEAETPDARRLASLAFVRATTGFVDVARRCHQYWGGLGVSLEMHVHHFSRRAKCAEQAWGGIEHHRETIARELEHVPLVSDR